MQLQTLYATPLLQVSYGTNQVNRYYGIELAATHRTEVVQEINEILERLTKSYKLLYILHSRVRHEKAI